MERNKVSSFVFLKGNLIFIMKSTYLTESYRLFLMKIYFSFLNNDLKSSHSYKLFKETTAKEKNPKY